MKFDAIAVSKINLFLEVLGKRPDGYHEIRTIFLPLSNPHDKILIEEGNEGIKIESDCEEMPSGEENICWKACAKFAEASGVKPRWKIKIEKNIPIAAGLGGGSSDAAAVLKILGKIYPDSCDIRNLAISLGADVAYFLDPKPAIGEGIGERIKTLNFSSDIPLLLVNPLFPVSSAWAYKNLIREDNSISIENMLQALQNGDIANIAKSIRNDLAKALYKKFPLLQILKEEILRYGALNVEISGSGPTLFAIFSRHSDLDRADCELTKKFGEALKIFKSSSLTSFVLLLFGF